jgi:hypothetical protein
MTASPPTLTGPETWGQTPLPAGVPVMDETGALPDVERGSVVVFRQFDVADEVDLVRAGQIVGAERLHVRPRGTPLILSNPPLALQLGVRRFLLGGREVEADLSARIFDFGAVSFRLRIGLPPGTSWVQAGELVRAAQVDEGLTRLARVESDRLCERLAPTFTGAHHSALFEDYVVLQLEQLKPSTTALSLPLGAIARLLSGEPPEAGLSATEVLEATRHRSSYGGADLCVSGWSTALVVEPTGDPDVLDVLELANAQLLELRYYDELLDRSLDQLYGEVASRRGRRVGPLRSYARVLHRTMAVMLEIAEFVERVENAIKIIGDTYLARLYGSAVDSLRIPAWERSVTRKQALLQQVYDVLRSEVDASRGLLAEALIGALIVIELVLAFRGG